MIVYTANYSYRGADRLDITAAGLRRAVAARETFEGAPFAPPWWAVAAVKGVEQAPPVPAAYRPVPEDDEARWQWYRAFYVGHMRASWRAYRAAWDALLARETVTLVCFCADRARCHRGILAELLVKAGAEDGGERQAT